MAQMTVPAEPSYKTTTYNGLKGADFANDPSLVARNHSPDLVNMISDNGGSPIKRKGWEVTDEANGKIANIWHFQMYGKKWHVAIVQGVSNSTIVEFDNDGAITTLTTLSGWTGKGTGFFFQSNDESKTGFYIYANGVHKVKPATDESTELTYYSNLTPTTPTVMEHMKYNGTGGISTQGVNMLTRKMSFEMWDDREAEDTYTISQSLPGTKTINLLANVATGRALIADFQYVITDGTSSYTYNLSKMFVKGTASTQSWRTIGVEFTVAYDGSISFTCSNVDGETNSLQSWTFTRITVMKQRIYRLFQTGSPTTISSIDKVEQLNEDGGWDNITSHAIIKPDTGADANKRILVTGVTLDALGSVSIDNIRITITAAGATGANKITECTCSTIYSQMTEGQVFVSGNPEYPQYVWYSDLADPMYFPDTNYLFVGGAGTKVTGMIPFGSQIAVLKEPSLTESTIFLISYDQATDQKIDVNGEQYTETRDVYKVKHGFSGVGSLTADSVFSLSDEPLFLSENGITGLVSNVVTSVNSVKNRSGFLDPKLLKEENLANAVATVHKNYYILCVNNHAYILDGRQKTNDWRGNTSYLYESYYWENIPASCIASDGEKLWFGTSDGRLCRFKNTGQVWDYSDNTRYGDNPIRVYPKEGETELSSTWFVDSNGDDVTPSTTDKYVLFDDTDNYERYTVFSYNGTTNLYEEAYVLDVITALWSTPADNDGMTQYYKTLQKKGSGCTVYPYARSKVTAYLEKDGLPLVKVGDFYADVFDWENIDFTRFTFIGGHNPRDDFFKKKMKKYKRLKIILVNDELNEGFGVMEIFKTYLVARFAKK